MQFKYLVYSAIYLVSKLNIGKTKAIIIIIIIIIIFF